jgi:Berberine and berberine like
MRTLGHPVFDHVGLAPFPAVQSLFDPLFGPGLQWYWRAHNLTELSDDAIARQVEHGSRIPTMLSTTHLYPLNGAAQRIGKNDTAYSFREALLAQVIVGVDPDPANVGQITTWCKDYWDALLPYSAGGAYVNFMMDEGQERVHATYRDNYERLACIKKQYDPTNFFRVNQNIRPSA